MRKIDWSFAIARDSWEYLELGKNLREHHVFAFGVTLFPETFRVPVYPLFLSLFQSLQAVVIAQVLIHCLTSFFILDYALWRGTRKRAILCTSLFALDSTVLRHVPLVLTETVFTFILALAVFAFLAEFPLVSGFFFSVGALTRVLLFYFPICLFWLWPKKDRIKFLVASYFLPVLWTLRNWVVAGYPWYTSALENNMACPASHIDPGFTGSAVLVLLHHPWAFMKLNFFGAFHLLFGTGLPWWPLKIVYALWLAFAYFLFFSGNSEHDDRTAMFLAWMLYLFILFSASQGYYRYRVPMMLIVALGACGTKKQTLKEEEHCYCKPTYCGGVEHPRVHLTCCHCGDTR